MYRVEMPLLGKPEVHYQCPHCRSDVISPLEEAGTNDKCPTCGREFTVPGAKDLAEHRQQQAMRRQREQSRQREAELVAKQKLEEREREDARRAEQARQESLGGNAPAYEGILQGARVLGFFAWLIGIVGGLSAVGAILLALIGATASQKGDLDISDKNLVVTGVAACLVYGVSCLVAAAFLGMQASLALAVRDLARNSFRR